MSYAIKIENLSKQYRLGIVGTGTLSHDLKRWWYRARGKEDPYLKVGEINTRKKQNSSNYVWALKDINLEVKDGEILGIVGANGAGKSTLLKILSKVTGPTTGSIKYKGRIGALLEVGTGFHKELTGRENVFLNGAILGMTKSEVQRKFDEIVDFSGCGKYIDTPVKRYSSGMMVRLGFAVAAHLEPEILVVDEVLAVGDAEFQKKAIGKMKDVSSTDGRTVLFVSHNMAAVQTLCTSAMLIENGKISLKGLPSEVVEQYLKKNSSINKVSIKNRSDRKGAGLFRFEKLSILDENCKECNFAVTGRNLYFKINISVLNPDIKMTVPLEISLLIRDHRGKFITTLATFFTDESPIGIENVNEITCFVPKLPLLPGTYYLDLWCAIGKESQDWLENAFSLRVEPGNYFHASFARFPNAERHGSIVIPQKWSSNPDNLK